MKKPYFIVAVVLVNTVNHTYSQNSYNIGTTAVPFLRISTDAQASGMGDAGIATTADVNSVYWNSGKLAFAEKKNGIGANYVPWLREWGSGMFVSSLAGYYKTNDQEAIYGMLKYFRPGDIQFTDNNGNKLQSYHPNEFAIQFGYSRKLSNRVGLGVGLKYIRSALASGVHNGSDFKPGNAVAVDLGFYYNLQKEDGNGWSFGGGLSNLGSRISYSNSADDKAFIPANLGLGAAYTKVLDKQNRLTLALDINKLLVPTGPNSNDSTALLAYKNKSVVGSWFSSFSDAPGGVKEELKEFQISAGAEYWFNDLFALRAGYFFEDKNKGGRKHFSAGAGIKYNVFTVNFSYLVPSGNTNRSPVANTMLFGLLISLSN